MTEVQQGNIYVGQEGDHVYDNPEPGSGNDFTTTHSRGKSRCGSHVMSFTSVWINSAIVILFVLVIGALALSIYAIVGRDQAVSGPCSCMVTTGSCSNDTVSGGDVQVQELNDTIIQVKELLNQTYTSFEDRYNALNERIISVIQSSVLNQNVSANNELNLYTGCEERVSSCILDASEAGTPPSSASCGTPPRPLTVAGMTNTDIYCSIDNSVGETNPIVASVNIFTGEIRCTCSLVALSTSTRQVACNLHVRRCPNTIQLN